MLSMYNVNRRDYYCLLNILDAIDKIKQLETQLKKLMNN